MRKRLAAIKKKLARGADSITAIESDHLIGIIDKQEKEIWMLQTELANVKVDRTANRRKIKKMLNQQRPPWVLI